MRCLEGHWWGTPSYVLPKIYFLFINFFKLYLASFESESFLLNFHYQILIDQTKTT